jgi:hypothetical protein
MFTLTKTCDDEDLALITNVTILVTQPGGMSVEKRKGTQTSWAAANHITGRELMPRHRERTRSFLHDGPIYGTHAP